MLHHGPNNVSRWMTWLPISLKNAAKCDKWYQLQNHSITESLNANGAWEKLIMSDPRACHISVSNKKTKYLPLFHGWLGNFWLFPKRAHIWTKCGHSHMVRLGASGFSFLFPFGGRDLKNSTNLEKTTNAFILCCAFFSV